MVKDKNVQAVVLVFSFRKREHFECGFQFPIPTWVQVQLQGMVAAVLKSLYVFLVHLSPSQLICHDYSHNSTSVFCLFSRFNMWFLNNHSCGKGLEQ